MTKRPFVFVVAASGLGLAAACGWFDQDPTAKLAAEVINGPATVLAKAELSGAPEIPPLRPGELEPLAAEGEGLHVLALAPRGSERDPSQVAVIFDRAMVPLTALAEGGPVECSPKITGRMRWAGTSTAVIVPQGSRFPGATHFECSVAKGTAALDGTALASLVSWSFDTPVPALKRSWPSNGESDWDEKEPLALRFNQRVTTAQVERQVHLKGPSGEAIRFSASLPAKERPEGDTVEIVAKLARDTAYTVVVPAGFSGDEGPLPSATESVISFHTVPRAAIVETRPTGPDVDPEESLRIEFATEVDGKLLADKIHISPEPPDGWRPAETWTSRYWYYSPRLAPRTAYTVRVDAGVVDIHGQKTDSPTSWTFTTGDLAPSLDAPWSDSQLYPANNPKTLPIRFRNVSQTTVRIEQLSARELVSQPGRWRTRLDGGGGRSVRIAPRPERNVLQRAMVDLSPDLTQGFGILRVTTSAPEVVSWDDRPQERVALLQITNLGGNVKLTPDGATVWVTALDSGLPVQGADVTLSREGHAPWTGKTDRDGVAIAAGEFYDDGESEWSGQPLLALIEQGADSAIIATEMTGPFSAWQHGIYPSFDADGTDVRVRGFADRGVYRPGDKVHVAASARIASLSGLANPGPKAAVWWLLDPDGTAVANGNAALSPQGNLAITTVLPADARLGDWQVQITTEGAVEGDTFVEVPVRAYRAPSFRVDTAAPARAILGETLNASAQAAYLFGTPMKGAKAKWSIRRSPLDVEFSEFEGYSFSNLSVSDLWSPSNYAEESVSTGTGSLDETGKLSIQQLLTAESSPRPYTYLIEATVTDTDRQQVSGRAEVQVDSADTYPGVRTEGSLSEAGKPVSASVVAVRNTGEVAASTSVKLTAIRRTWDSVRERAMDGTWKWVSTVKETQISTGSIGTGATPKPWSFTPDSGGYYVVRAELRDRKGRVATAETGTWVYGGDVSWARTDDNSMELVADKQEYRPGDTAHILVKAPKKGLRALVTAEREGIWTRKVVTLASTATTLDIPITEAMAPNAFVSVVAAEGAPAADALGAGIPGTWYGIVNLLVSAEAQRIAATIATNKTSYQPGETVTATVATTRGGKPLAQAHVVLWAVDYGVLSLTAYETPDLYQQFYAEHPLSVITADNRQSVFDRALRLAKGAEVGGGGGGSATAVRSNFETTPLWEGDLTTLAGGQVTTSFPLPDNLTTFRLMAVVDDGKAGFGKAESEIKVNLPLIARPALPRFFRTDDRAFAGVVIHNNTATEAAIAVTASAEGATVLGAPRTVQVPANGATEVPFGIKDFTANEVKFHFTATGAGNSDAVDWTVPMKRARPSELVATAGSTTATETVAINLPKDALRETGGLDLMVSASALVGIGSSVDYVVDYPHGCMEQTTSRMRVAIAALRVREQAGITKSPEELDKIVKAALSRMSTFSTVGGGFSYWPGQYRTDALATAYAAEALAEARAAKFEFDPELLAGAQRTLREVLSGEHFPEWYDEEAMLAVQARAALALARSGSPDGAFTNRLAEALPKLPNFSKAQALEAFARNNPRDPRIAALLTDLEAQVHVESTSAALLDREQSGWRALWWGEDVGSIEFVRSLLVARPNHPLLPRLVAHVVAARKEGRWSNTWSTAEALTALADYASANESGSVKASVKRGDNLVFAAELGKGGQRSAHIDMALLDNSPVNFSAANGRLYYEARLAYAQPVLPPRDEGFTLERKMEVIEGGGGTGRVEPGSLVRVTLRVVTPVDRYNVALVDALPAGLEPVDSSFATERSDLGQDTGSRGRDTGNIGPERYWWSSWIFNRRELRDDEVIWYADYMPAGIHTQTWIARASTPGNYAQPAAAVYEMYAPDVYGRTEAGRFVVGSAVAAR